MSVDMTENKREFLRLMRQATLKTGIAIYGCGCCDSPYLEPINYTEKGEEAGYVECPETGGLPGQDGGQGQVKWVSKADRHNAHLLPNVVK